MMWLGVLLCGTGIAALAGSALLHYARSRDAEHTPVSHYLMGTAAWAMGVLVLFVAHAVFTWPPLWVLFAVFGSLCTSAGVARIWLILRDDPTDPPQQGG